MDLDNNNENQITHIATQTWSDSDGNAFFIGRAEYVAVQFGSLSADKIETYITGQDSSQKISNDTLPTN